MFFSDIRGHKDLLSELEDKVLSNDMAGAYLFEGPKGIGKFKVASKLSRYVACVGTKDDSCVCSTCKNSDSDPDIMVVGDHDKSVIKAEELDSVSSFLDDESHKGSTKVLLVGDVDRLSHHAADDLLKTLEEPCGDRLIVFTTSYPEAVPSTLLSRIERVKFDPLSRDTIVDILKDNGKSGVRTNELGKYSKSMIHSFLSDPEMYARQRDNSIKFLKYLRKLNEDGMYSLVEDIQSEDGDVGIINFAEMLVMSLSDISKIRMGAPVHVVNISKIEILEGMAKYWHESTTLPILNLFTSVLKEYKADKAMSPKYKLFRSVTLAYNTVKSFEAKKDK